MSIPASQSPLGTQSSPLLSESPVTHAQLSKKSPPGRKPEAVDILLITSNEFFAKRSAEELQRTADQSNVPMRSLFVESLEGASGEEKRSSLKNNLLQLMKSGKIDGHTQFIVHLHGTVGEDSHYLATEDGAFVISTREIVSLIWEVMAMEDACLNNAEERGTIHIGSCGIATAANDLKDHRGLSFLYGGKNITDGNDADAIFLGMIRLLAEYRKDPEKNRFPSPQDFYQSAGSISGEKVSMVGGGEVFHIKSKFEPLSSGPAFDFTKEKLERVLVAKVAHGKATSVDKVLQLMGDAVKNIEFSYPLAAVLMAVEDKDLDEKLRMLVRAGVNINEIYLSGNTVLHQACESCLPVKVGALLRQNADFQLKNENGQSALDIAINSGNIELFDCFLQAGCDVNSVDQRGNSALHVACKKGDRQFVEFLLEEGADPNIKNQDSDSPLGLAKRGGYFDVADLLSSSGVKRDASLIGYSTAELLELLTNRPEVLSSFLKKAQNKEKILIQLFNELRQSFNDSYSSGVFDFKKFHGHKVALMTLIREIPDSGFAGKSDFYNFIFSLATSHQMEYFTFFLSCPDVAEKLATELGQVQQFFCESFWTDRSQLIDAAFELKTELSERINPDRAQLLKADESGFIPLERACLEGSLSRVTILDSATPDVKFSPPRNADGKTLLMLACEANSLDIVEWLVEAGVNLTLTDKQGRTALDYATKSGNAGIRQKIARRLSVSS